MKKVVLKDGRTATIIREEGNYYLVKVDQLQTPIVCGSLSLVQASPLEWWHQDYITICI